MDVGSRGRQAALLRHATDGVKISRIAASAAALWQDVDLALSPIIGALGVRAIYRRSVNVIRERYPWLQGAYAQPADSEPFAVLKAALEQQTPTTAAAANGALLQAFYEVLEQLIGGSLTTRLLEPALDKRATGDVQET